MASTRAPSGTNVAADMLGGSVEVEMSGLVQGYDELRLRLDRSRGSRYRLLAATHFAEATVEFEIPAAELGVAGVGPGSNPSRGQLATASLGLNDAKRLGEALFESLFHGSVRDIYRDALADARRRHRGLRIMLCLSGSPELCEVPWEYLFDGSHFLATSPLTPVVRYLDLPRRSRTLRVSPPLRLLGIISNPTDYRQLNVDEERQNLEHALASVLGTQAVELHWLSRPTLPALLNALRTNTFHGLHFIGHGMYDVGSDKGALLFEDEGGWARPVTGDQLGLILQDFSSLRLAVLNACEGARSSRHDPFSGVAGALIQRDVPAVIAMQFEISDDSAITFAASFYEALAAGAGVDASVAAARLSMFANHTENIEWGKPVLFMRVADAQLFDVREPPMTSRDAMDDRTSARDASSLRMDALALLGRWRRLLGESTRQRRGFPKLDRRFEASPAPWC